MKEALSKTCESMDKKPGSRRERRTSGATYREGFAPLPRRLDEVRPERVGPSAEAVANVRDFVLSPREFTTRVGGLFLFVHDLVRLDGDCTGARRKAARLRHDPGRPCLACRARAQAMVDRTQEPRMALVADEGLALFCGLNAIPKKSFLSEYSSRITPQKVSRLLGLWHDQVTGEALVTGESLNLDFHSVPYFGGHPLVESHYLSMRSRRQPSILTFLARTPPAKCSAIRMPTSARARRRGGLSLHRVLETPARKPAAPPRLRRQAHHL